MDNERLDNLLGELEETANEFKNYKVIYEALNELSKKNNKQVEDIYAVHSTIKKDHAENVAELKEVMAKILDISNQTKEELLKFKNLFDKQETSIKDYILQCNKKIGKFILFNSVVIILNVLLMIFLISKFIK